MMRANVTGMSQAQIKEMARVLRKRYKDVAIKHKRRKGGKMQTFIEFG